MKRITVIVLCALLVLSAAACGVKKPGGIRIEKSPDTFPSSVIFTDEGNWPENGFTQGLPTPPGTVEWVMVDSEREACGIRIGGIARKQFKEYYTALLNSGFTEIEKVSGKGQAYISIGTLLSDGSKAISLAFADSVLMLTLTKGGIDGTKAGFLRPGNLTNVYVSAYSTYDPQDGIQVITELYVPEGQTPSPQFTAVNGLVTVTVGENTTTHYLGSNASGASAGIAVNTARLGASGEKGFVVIAGTAYADNAPAGCGSFAISYEITIP